MKYLVQSLNYPVFRNFKITLIASLLVLINSSCNSDDGAIDIRDQAEDYYSFNVDANFINGTGGYEGSGSLAIEKFGKDAIKIIISNPTYYGSTIYTRSIEETDNGFVFNIESEINTDKDGDNYLLSGVPTFTHNDALYHGKFTVTQERLELLMFTDYEEDEVDFFNSNIVLVAIKW